MWDNSPDRLVVGHHDVRWQISRWAHPNMWKLNSKRTRAQHTGAQSILLASPPHKQKGMVASLIGLQPPLEGDWEVGVQPWASHRLKVWHYTGWNIL